MKISIIGAGNVGATTAMRIAQARCGKVVLFDIVKGLAQGKCLDMEDARSLLKNDYDLTGTDDIHLIKNSDIVVVTAGLARKPGMTREDLLAKNTQILKDVCNNIKTLCSEAIVIIVTNPLDLMTYSAIKLTGFKPQRILGMGITLDSSRFANLISKELSVPVTDIEAVVIGTHGEGMMPLAGLTKVKGKLLTDLVKPEKAAELVKRTGLRGAEIVGLLGSGSAYYAPSAAIADLVEVIASGKSAVRGISAYLNGEYGVKDVCIGTPCQIGKAGIEKILEVRLSKEEKDAFLKSTNSLKEQIKNNPL
ncbi:MAG: malate dehydrogenase [Candidatus Omnitrophica bacterium]|nr:malate dehydrogenase [Candidatus Omnitrophota bacterium]